MTKEDVAKLRAEIESSLAQAKSIEDLNSIKVKYLGKKGLLTNLLKSLKELPLEERRELGSHLNQIKDELERLLRLRKGKSF